VNEEILTKFCQVIDNLRNGETVSGLHPAVLSLPSTANEHITQQLVVQSAQLREELDSIVTYRRELTEKNARLQKQLDDALSRSQTDNEMVRTTMEKNIALSDEIAILHQTTKKAQRELVITRLSRGNLKNKYDRAASELKLLEESVKLCKEHNDCVSQVLAYLKAQELNLNTDKKTIQENEELAMKAENATLKADHEETVKELWKVMEAHEKATNRAENLEKQLQFVKPLVDIGRKLRRVFQENATFYAKDHFENAMGMPNAKTIEDVNKAAQYADVLADAADISLSKLDGEDTTEKEKDFRTIYGLVLDSEFLAADHNPKLIELLDMKGTMTSCGSFTKYTNDPALDKSFLTFAYRCQDLFPQFRRQNAQKGSSNPLEKSEFEECHEVEHAFVVMQDIVQKSVQKERYRARAGKSNSAS
jgi:hypothetical protein